MHLTGVKTFKTKLNLNRGNAAAWKQVYGACAHKLKSNQKRGTNW